MSDNIAIRGYLASKKGGRIITSSFEHPAVMECFKSLENFFDVVYLSPDSSGKITADILAEKLTSDTCFVSIMHINNETGAINEIEKISELLRRAGIVFHTDAVQSFLKTPFKYSKTDMASVSGHKTHGPKGVGFLYCRRGLYPDNFMDGGAQERGHRAGTENVAGIVGMAAALKEACGSLDEKARHLSSLRDRVQEGLLRIPGSRLNGGDEHRLPGTVNVSFEKVDGESLLFQLDLMGIAASSGSACASGSVDPSHVLLAIGVPYHMAHGSLRISLGRYNTAEEADRIVEAVTDAVALLRGER